MRAARWLAIVGMVAGGVPAVARAQAPDPAALEEAAYRDFVEGRLEEALRGYERVYRLAPRAEVLFAIGNLQQRLGQCDRAIETLEDYLASDAPAGAAKANELIEGCRATLATAMPTPVPDAVVGEPTPVVPPRDDRGPGRRRIALVLGGAAVVLGGVALVSELKGQAHLDQAADGSEAEYVTANRYHYAAQGLAIGAGACAVTGVVLWLTGRRRPPAALAMTPSAGGAVVAWRGSF